MGRRQERNGLHSPPPLLLPLAPASRSFYLYRRMKQGERGNEEGKRAAGLGSVLEMFLAKGKTDNRLPGHEAARMEHWEPGKS